MVVICNGFTVAVRGYSLHPEVWRLINVRAARHRLHRQRVVSSASNFRSF